jgi:hypothetical protein
VGLTTPHCKKISLLRTFKRGLEPGRIPWINDLSENRYWWESEKQKRPLGRPKRRWVDNIKMDLREIGWDGVIWIDMAQDRDQWRAVVNRVLNFRVP